MNKLLAVLFVVAFVTIVSSHFAYADIINFGKGGQQFHYGNPKATLNPQSSTSTNYFVTIILPDNNSPQITGILSNANYSLLQQNIATMAVVNIIPTNTPSNLDYCKTALSILEGQDGYLNLIYNVTKGVDLTGLVYPSMCYVETGKNPIDGQPISTPEFFGTSMIVLGISLACFAAFSTAKRFRN